MTRIDKSKRLAGNRFLLEECQTMDGKKKYFNSVAEMIATRARELADKVFVYYYDEEVTYAQLNERCNRVANFLKEKGVIKGDIVSIMVLNSPECYYTTFGAQKLGAVAGQINYMLMPPEIAYVLDDSQPKLVFVGSEYMTTFAKGYALARHKPIVVEVVTEVQHGEKIAETTLKSILANYPADEALIDLGPNDPFMLMYSSGTTGKPKGILLTNMNEMHICRSMPVGNVYQDDEVFLLLAPMFHVSPLCIYTYSSIYMGHSIVIRSMFSPTDFWPTVIKYGVTCVWGTPAMFAYVMYQVAAEDVDVSKVKIRHGSMGGAPVPLELIGEFEDKFGFTLSDGYGLTESCGFCATTDGRPYKHGSIGGCHGECEIEIMDDDNNILPYGEPGELCVRGGTVMLGYFNNPHATAETIKDNWLHTGDLAYMDEEGYIFFMGRTKEMINRGGENIYPREVEIPLEAHPKVAQVAVVGKPDPALGEKVKACIILKEGAVMTEQEVKDYLKEQIAKYKVPEFVQFYDTFPLNASGKILKSQLKD